MRRAVVVFSAVASALCAASAATAYFDDAHAGGVKVIHFHAEKPEELKDLMVERGIDFVMTNHLTPMIEAFKALGLSADATGIPQPKAVREADALAGVRVPPRAVEDDPITYIAHQGEEALEISKGMRKGVWIDFKDFRPPFAENVFRMLDDAGFNLPHVFSKGKLLYTTPPALAKRLKKAGYWLSIWFAYDSGTAEYYREVGVDAFVTNCKANTFPATKPETAARARLMRLLAQVPGVVSDAAQGVRAKALELCVWSPERAAETIEKSGRAPKTAEEAFEILVNQNSTERNTRT